MAKSTNSVLLSFTKRAILPTSGENSFLFTVWEAVHAASFFFACLQFSAQHGIISYQIDQGGLVHGYNEGYRRARRRQSDDRFQCRSWQLRPRFPADGAAHSGGHRRAALCAQHVRAGAGEPLLPNHRLCGHPQPAGNLRGQRLCGRDALRAGKRRHRPRLFSDDAARHGRRRAPPDAQQLESRRRDLQRPRSAEPRGFRQKAGQAVRDHQHLSRRSDAHSGARRGPPGRLSGRKAPHRFGPQKYSVHRRGTLRLHEQRPALCGLLRRA